MFGHHNQSPASEGWLARIVPGLALPADPATSARFPRGAPKQTALDPGCAKTCAFNLRVESSSEFGQSEIENARDSYPKKAIEKMVLRFLGSRTFSHGLDPSLTLASDLCNS